MMFAELFREFHSIHSGQSLAHPGFHVNYPTDSNPGRSNPHE